MGQTNVPVDFFHWTPVPLPIIALLVLLSPLRCRARKADPGAIFVAIQVAFFTFQTPISMLPAASAKGVWKALLLFYVMRLALLIYQITRQTSIIMLCGQMRRDMRLLSRRSMLLAGLDSY